MAGSHFDLKRIEVFDILEYFRFGKDPAIAPVDVILSDSTMNEVTFHTSNCALPLLFVCNFIFA